MKGTTIENAKQVLVNYLDQNNCRKTPERFAVLDALYSSNTYLSIDDLSKWLNDKNFPVSRATIYNTLKLFQQLHLVVCHKLRDGLKYEACYTGSHCYRICTVCGKEMEVKLPQLTAMVETAHIKRFRKESFSMFIYGICSTCQAIMTRKQRKINKVTLIK